MGSYLVAAFVAVFALAIGQAVVRRKRNPYGAVSYDELPEALRAEVERVLPDFSHTEARITKRGDKARLSGNHRGESVRIEADFDPSGALVDFEVDTGVGARKTGIANLEDVTVAAQQEVDRVLGPHRAEFQTARISQGALQDGERVFEVKGRSGEWTWEIEVSAMGRLLEVEKEKRPRRG
jgi:hypothetical protein